MRCSLLLLCVAAIATGCSQPLAPAPSPAKVAAEGLPNLYRLHEKAFAGGQPEGEAAFAELARLGVKTVISVDGARPEVALAAKHGLRYVHLPHGYGGVPEIRAKELAKAVRDLPGPIYIHCHHGKHRSPAAAAIACVGAGLLDPQGAVAFLKTAGTSENYRGLYQAAERARRFDDAVLAELKVDFPETAKLPAMAEAMVAIEHHHDHLKQIAAADWKSPAKHPDLVPAHEVLLLRERFTELVRSAEMQQQPRGFQELIRASEAAAVELEMALTKGIENPTMAAAALAMVTQHCAACHQTYRDVPLGEK